MRALRALALTVLLVAAGAAPARAVDPTFEAALAPERITFGEPGAEARLTVRTGAEAETFWLTAFSAGETYVDFGGRPVGGPLLEAGCGAQPRFEGPGGPTSGRGCLVSSTASCGVTPLAAFHGADLSRPSFEVTIPADSQTTVVVPLAHAATAPWPTSRYEASFRLEPGVGGTLEQAIQVGSGLTAPAGRTGVPIELSLEPGGAPPCVPGPEIRGPVTVRGRTEPALAGQEVVLRTASVPGEAPRELARVRVAGDGTFVFAGWRPAPGYHEVAASYTAQRSERADDFSSPLIFTAAAEAVVSKAAIGLRLGDRRLRADRAGLVRLRLHCPAAAIRPCADRMRISRGGRTLATRSVTLAPGRARTVRLRLGPAARRSLARRRTGLRVLVRIGDAEGLRATLSRRRAR